MNTEMIEIELNISCHDDVFIGYKFRHANYMCQVAEIIKFSLHSQTITTNCNKIEEILGGQ